jgi:hypothetical protein
MPPAMPSLIFLINNAHKLVFSPLCGQGKSNSWVRWGALSQARGRARYRTTSIPSSQHALLAPGNCRDHLEKNPSGNAVFMKCVFQGWGHGSSDRAPA